MSQVEIHPTAIVSPNAQIGQGVKIGPYCIVEGKAVLADGVVLHSHVVIGGTTKIGENTEIYPHAVLGMPPQDLGYKGEETGLIIGKNNIIREQVTMHTGTPRGHGVTRVGDNGFFMATIHIAHDCIIGNNAIMANRTSVAGHAIIGDYCYLGATCFIHQNNVVGDHAIIGGMAKVTGDVIPFATADGNPARLKGLNLVGLKRRGFSKERIFALRKMFSMLSNPDRKFEDRVAQIDQELGQGDDVRKVVEFLRQKRNRPLCLPDEGKK